VPYRNAPVSETGRLRLARCVIEDGLPLRRAAERLHVSATTAAGWAGCRSRILVVRCNRIVGYETKMWYKIKIGRIKVSGG
jgi:hypothetical protein